MENGASDGARTRDLRRDRPADNSASTKYVSTPPCPDLGLKSRIVETGFDLPVGGTTGLCHVSNARLDEAADWYRGNRDQCPRPIVAELRRRFGLSTHDAVKALALAAGRRA